MIPRILTMIPGFGQSEVVIIYPGLCSFTRGSFLGHRVDIYIYHSVNRQNWKFKRVKLEIGVNIALWLEY